MRIAYLTADRGIPFGGSKGASVHVSEVVRALARRGAEVVVLPRRVEPGATGPDGVTLDPLPATATDAALADWLEDTLLDLRADALYERVSLHTAAGAAAAGRAGIPYLVELNAPLPEEAARYRALERPEEAERLERSVLASADVVLAVSGPLARYASDRGATCVEVFPNAVDLERFGSPASHVLLEPRCVFLGTLRPWHGAEMLAESWRLLGDDAPPLLVVGDGPGRAALEAAGAHVTGAVPHDEVPWLLATASIGLAPYAADAPGYFSPLKLFEYLAAGLAVVAGAIPGVREGVGDEHAVLVPPGDPVALAAAVSELCSDPPRRARLGAAGREHVAARHTWDHRAQRILELVDELQPAVAA